MGSAYQVLSHQKSMTENTEKCFGVVLDVFLPFFLMEIPSVIFLFSQVKLSQIFAFHLFVQSRRSPAEHFTESQAKQHTGIQVHR